MHQLGKEILFIGKRLIAEQASFQHQRQHAAYYVVDADQHIQLRHASSRQVWFHDEFDDNCKQDEQAADNQIFAILKTQLWVLFHFADKQIVRCQINKQHDS